MPNPIDFHFDFIHSASAVINDDAIMGLLARFSAQRPGQSNDGHRCLFRCFTYSVA